MSGKTSAIKCFSRNLKSCSDVKGESDNSVFYRVTPAAGKFARDLLTSLFWMKHEGTTAQTVYAGMGPGHLEIYPNDFYNAPVDKLMSAKTK